MKKRTYAEFGSISSGTLRLEDLIPAFAYALEELARAHGGMKSYCKLIKECETLTPARLQELGDGLIAELTEALEEYAPPFGYFGAHPGDGADYGFWLYEDWQQAFTDGEGLIVGDLSDTPKGYSGDLAVINDHGNVTLYHCTRGRCREVWSLV